MKFLYQPEIKGKKKMLSFTDKIKAKNLTNLDTVN